MGVRVTARQRGSRADAPKSSDIAYCSARVNGVWFFASPRMLCATLTCPTVASCNYIIDGGLIKTV
jgi:hypothetical protein